MSLNPCSNGILKYLQREKEAAERKGLNPCSNGILKYKELAEKMSKENAVLILVLMEY